MRSSAIFLIACLSAAIAKPVDYTIPTVQFPSAPLDLGQGLAPLDPVLPEPAGSAESFGNIGNNGFGVSGPPPSEANPVNNVIGTNYLQGAPSTVDRYTISSAFGVGAEQVSDTSAFSTYIANSDRQRTFVEPTPIEWARETAYNVHLGFPGNDGGTTTFICREGNLGCCDTTYTQAGQTGFVKGCHKCVFSSRSPALSPTC